MKYFFLSMVFAIGLVTVLTPVTPVSAAVPTEIPGIVSSATSTAFTFVGDVLDNYTSLILWVVFLMFIIGTIVGLAWKLARGRTR